jgi:hypothetical protein
MRPHLSFARAGYECAKPDTVDQRHECLEVISSGLELNNNPGAVPRLASSARNNLTSYIPRFSAIGHGTIWGGSEAVGNVRGRC